MHKYGFELGRQWRLSVAELRSFFGFDGEVIGGQIWVGEFEREIEAEVLARLGGTIKIIKFFDEASSISDVENKFLEHLTSQENQKVKFALNLYNFNNEFLKNHKNILKFLKTGLKDAERGARFYNKPNQNLKSVVIFEEKLDKKGTDLNCLKISEHRYLLGYCVSVQNFKNYSFRDYDRPARDAKSGMLPPKLAQMMINLACEGELTCLLYDPFCGSGTVLMEGLLMGYKVIGSDISEKAIKDSEANLEWLKKEFDVAYDYDLFLKDATKLEASDFPIQPNAIASEVYLGPPQSKFPSDKEIRDNFAEVSDIVKGFLKVLRGCVRRDSNLALALPYYKGRSGSHFIENFEKEVVGLGYEVEKFEELSTNRGSLLYSRKHQIVGREIFKLKLVEK